MPLLSRRDRKLAEILAKITTINPFLPERVALEHEVLGSGFDASEGIARSRPIELANSKNLQLLKEQLQIVAEKIRDRIAEQVTGDDDEYASYMDMVKHLIFFGVNELWSSPQFEPTQHAGVWQKFCVDYAYWFEIPGFRFGDLIDKVAMFSGMYQIHRAYQQIYQNFYGRSSASIRLRAAIWQSIFTHDFHRYQRGLFRYMSRIVTLIVGASGTGKELIANAVGRSQYLPFDEKKMLFPGEPEQLFFPIHLAAMPATLVESELFGHAKGAYTGATDNRSGWFETAGVYGSVFLDEVGEIDHTLQVKLLRVLQTRQFSRVGEHRLRQFEGKLIAATNRDLLTETKNGSFREDLYYRLCGNVIQTPTLKEQISDSPDELERSIRFIAGKIAPSETESITADALRWIEQELPPDYHWPGNFRELEQFVHGIIVHNKYEFMDQRVATPDEYWANTMAQLSNLELTADQLLQRYCTYAYGKTGSFEQAADHLKLDRRTVKAKLDQQLLLQLSSGSLPQDSQE